MALDDWRSCAPYAAWLIVASVWAFTHPARAGDLVGAAVTSQPSPAILAWGDGVTRWPLSAGAPGRFLEGRRFSAGCAGPDGTLYLLEGVRLIVSRPPYDREAAFEPDTEFQDCLPWSMGGRSGVLIPHRHLQLRFYSQTAPPVDLYSIYTPSKQGGLLEADIDADGRTDLLWGNYWLKRPDKAGAHWRLFAINTFFEQPDSALARLAWPGRGALYWGASAGVPRLALLTPGPDPRQLWRVENLPDPPPRIRAILSIEGGLVVSHAAGVDLYVRRKGVFSKRLLDAKSAAALFRIAQAVWAVFDDGPGIVYRLR